MPTLMPRPSATATDHPVTRAGRGDATWTSAARALPARRPAMPPSSARMADSARHWRRMPRRRRHLHRDHGRLAPSIQGLEGGERQHDESIPGLSQHRALLRDDALDGELRAADPNRAADGELRGAEQLVRYVEAEHRDQPPLPLI